LFMGTWMSIAAIVEVLIDARIVRRRAILRPLAAVEAFEAGPREEPPHIIQEFIRVGVPKASY
jgi:phage-related protein